MANKNRIFSDISKVSRTMMITLQRAGFINKHGLPHSWAYMSKFLQKEYVTKKEAKALVLLEMERGDGKEPRLDLIERLVRYIGRAEKEDVLGKIKTQLNKK